MSVTLRQLMLDHRDAIVRRFVAQVQRGALSPPGVTRSLLVDHIPIFLDEIVEELTPERTVRPSQDAGDDSPTARQHGAQRWSLGYDLEGVVREYGVLRHVIVEVAKEMEATVTLDEVDVLSKCLNVGVAEAAAEYARHRDGELNSERASLAFLAEAGQLLTSSLDYTSTLARLTRLLVPRLADWCAVHLEGASIDEMPIAHVDPAKIPLLRELYRRFPVPSDSPDGHPRVIRMGEPLIVTHVDPDSVATSAQNDEHRALLRQIQSCSWMVLPLRVQETTFGALVLAYSDSQRHYAESDLVLAGELARRAAVAIDNARLYDLSQKERSRVEAATRAKDEFVAMVSHELRTPLNAILGWSRLLRSGSLNLAKREHAVEVIERNARAQNQLVADLLDISRIISGKMRVTLSQVDLANTVEMALEGIRPAVEAKRITLKVDLEAGDTVMRGDGERLQQVVWNLVTNAVKFTPKGGTVSVVLRRVESDFELVVEDSGEGISPAFLPQVFDSFRQSDTTTARVHGGLGIGLSIAKHLVELHGGVIDARSAGLGHGATFVVRLPVGALVSASLGVKTVTATKPSESPSLPHALHGVRVLVVDDEPDAREMLGVLLEMCGAEVQTVASVAEAIAALEPFHRDVMVSDIGMPDADGHTLIRAVRTSPSEVIKAIPAIALTAYARSDDRTRALVAGFNVHLTKPVEPDLLVRTITDLVASRPSGPRG